MEIKPGQSDGKLSFSKVEVFTYKLCYLFNSNDIFGS